MNGFHVPDIPDLSKEQAAIIDLPSDGIHLIVGPPGTGKTVMAVYRSRLLAKRDVPTSFLVFNNALNDYLVQTIRANGGESATYHSFFWRWHRQHFNSNVPTLRPYEIDWDQMKQRVLTARVAPPRVPHLIVDEGQDFAPGFYPFVRVIAERVTVFADQHQRLTDVQSNLSEIESGLGVKKVHRLETNFRNSLPIARLAGEYFVKTGPTDAPPLLPDRDGERPVLVRYESEQQQFDAIKQYQARFPQQRIGVLVPFKNLRGRAIDELRRRGCVNLQTYDSDEPKSTRAPLDFSLPGISVLTFDSSKGLEFDAVFMPMSEQWRLNPAQDPDRMKMYVMISRARTRLQFLYSGDREPAILADVPEMLLARRS